MLHEYNNILLSSCQFRVLINLRQSVLAKCYRFQPCCSREKPVICVAGVFRTKCSKATGFKPVSPDAEKVVLVRRELLAGYGGRRGGLCCWAWVATPLDFPKGAKRGAVRAKMGDAKLPVLKAGVLTSVGFGT